MARISITKEAVDPFFNNIRKLNIQRGGVDQFFNNVSLLLPMDASFADFSSNNFALTANGNAQISSAQSKFGGGSVYFDGNGDYLELPLDPAFDFGSDNFTIECWFYSIVSGFQTLVARWGSGGNAFFLGFNTNSSDVQLYINDTAAVIAGSPQVNQWNHIAAVRDGSNIKLFLNGTQVGSTYNIGNTAINLTTEKLRVGDDNNGGNPGTTGYIDDLRITKGVARYTSNFAPPGPLLNIGKLNITKSRFPMTNLLAFWRFNENSTTPSVGNPSYFLTNAGSITYSTGKVGGSINLPAESRIRVDENLWDMVASPTSYSVAFWVKKNSLSGSGQGAVIAGSIFGPMGFFFVFGTNIDGNYSNYENGISYCQITGATQYSYINAPFSVNLDEWIHVVGTYDLATSTRKLYVNGILAETQNGITPPTSVQHYSWNGFAINGSTIGTNSSEYGGDHSFDGFGLWSRALTNAEIAALYNNGAGLEP